ARYDNYTSRKFGYYANIESLSAKTPEERWSYIRDFINIGVPLIIITKSLPTNPTHHRVICGYDERTKVLFVHDPWEYSIDPIYQGEFSAMSIEPGSWLGSCWANNEYKIAIVRPIDISLTIETQPVLSEGQFILKCVIDNTFMTESRNLSLQLTLPTGYNLLNGSETMYFYDFNGTATQAWEVNCSTPLFSDYITAQINSLNESISYGGKDKIFPAHPQNFITNISSDYVNDSTPCVANITIDVDIPGSYSAALYCFTIEPNGSCVGITTKYNNVIYENASRMICETGPNQPGNIVFCYFKITYDYGLLITRAIVLYIINSDIDEDGVYDYNELTEYFTDMYNPDSDFDGLSDGEEIFIYETNPNNNNTDDDGILDFDEVFTYGTNPNSNDTDNDLLLDYDEIFVYGTNPCDSDTDGDGMSDYDEINRNFDPLDPKSNAFRKYYLPVICSVVPLIAIVATTVTTFYVLKKKKLKNNNSLE
ncbi:MAG: hypothetical protein FK734_00175, partial [Asgard group archaeon]|nr:hypothetical protein [Asgard group archaeon]